MPKLQEAPAPKPVPFHVQVVYHGDDARRFEADEATDLRIERKDGELLLAYDVAGKAIAHKASDVLRFRINHGAPLAPPGPLDARVEDVLARGVAAPLRVRPGATEIG